MSQQFSQFDHAFEHYNIQVKCIIDLAGSFRHMVQP